MNTSTYTCECDTGYTMNNGNCVINRTSISIPTSPPDKTYNKQSQNHGITYDSSNVEIAGGTLSAIEANGWGTGQVTSYTVTFRLKNTTTTEWSDGTITDKNVTWKINKATPTFRLPNTRLLDGCFAPYNSTTNIAYTYEGDVAYTSFTCTPQDHNAVASCSVTSSSIVVTTTSNYDTQNWIGEFINIIIPEGRNYKYLNIPQNIFSYHPSYFDISQVNQNYVCK